MKLSRFKTILKNNLSKWNIDMNENKAKFTLVTSENVKLYFTDIDYIRNTFELKDFKIDTANLGDITLIKIKLEHNLKFEEE